MRIMFRIAWCSAQWSSHNPEAAGSSPAPAIEALVFFGSVLFLF